MRRSLCHSEAKLACPELVEGKNLNRSSTVIPNPFGFAQGRLDLESILSPKVLDSKLPAPASAGVTFFRRGSIPSQGQASAGMTIIRDRFFTPLRSVQNDRVYI